MARSICGGSRGAWAPPSRPVSWPPRRPRRRLCRGRHGPAWRRWWRSGDRPRGTPGAGRWPRRTACAPGTGPPAVWPRRGRRRCARLLSRALSLSPATAASTPFSFAQATYSSTSEVFRSARLSASSWGAGAPFSKNCTANSSTRSRPAATSAAVLQMRRSGGTPTPSQQTPSWSRITLKATQRVQPLGSFSGNCAESAPSVDVARDGDVRQHAHGEHEGVGGARARAVRQQDGGPGELQRPARLHVAVLGRPQVIVLRAVAGLRRA